MSKRFEFDIDVVKGTTPVGTAVFPRLDKPDTKFNEKGVFRVQLHLSPTEAADLISQVDAMTDEAFEAVERHLTKRSQSRGTGNTPIELTKHYAYKQATDRDGNETGDIEFSFKTNAHNKDGDLKTIRAFGPDGKLLPRGIIIGGGSKIIVGFIMAPFYMAATKLAGTTLYLNGVQVAKLIEPGGDASTYGFTEIEGAEPIIAPEPVSAPAGQPAAGDEELEDSDF